MSDSSDTTALSAVMAAAQRENLGALRASFAPKRVNAAALIGMFIFGLIGLIVVVGIYFFVVAFQTPNLNRSRAARRLHFFDGGLIVADANGPTAVFRWESMSVLQAITRRYANGVYVGTTYVYTLSGANGVTAKVTNFFADQEKCGTMIQNEVTRAQLETPSPTVRNSISLAASATCVESLGTARPTSAVLRTAGLAPGRTVGKGPAPIFLTETLPVPR